MWGIVPLGKQDIKNFLISPIGQKILSSSVGRKIFNSEGVTCHHHNLWLTIRSVNTIKLLVSFREKTTVTWPLFASFSCARCARIHDVWISNRVPQLYLINLFKTHLHTPWKGQCESIVSFSFVQIVMSLITLID